MSSFNFLFLVYRVLHKGQYVSQVYLIHSLQACAHAERLSIAVSTEGTH